MPHLIAPQLISARPSGSYQVDYSCRFNDDDSTYLTRTPGASNRKTWTFSAWIKGSTITSASAVLFWAGSDDNNNTRVQVNNGTFYYVQTDSGSNADLLQTSILFRDPTAWYHIVWAVDTQATESDRVKLYVNGIEIPRTSGNFTFLNYPSQDFDTFVNSANAHYVGAYNGSSTFFDGYMSQVCLIDGFQLDADSFGELDADGVWRPKTLSGLTFGTNGFLLDFANASDLGNDVSGNGNDFTSSGLTTADRVTDTPTTNYCVMNILTKFNNAGTFTVSDGNLDVDMDATNTVAEVLGSIAFDPADTAGYYFECRADTTSSGARFGVCLSTDNYHNTSDISTVATCWMYRFDNGDKANGSGWVSYGSAPSAGDTLMCAVKNGKIWFGKEGTWFNSGNPVTEANPAYSNLAAPVIVCYHIDGASNVKNVTFGFGQTGFDQTKPSGMKDINTANLSAPTIKDGTAHFQPTAYSGTSGTTNISQSGNSTFQPDFVWLKRRDAGSSNHGLFDVIRGATKLLSSNLTDGESTNANSLTSFNSNGFGLGTGATDYNGNGNTYIAWQWKANGSGSSNTDGSITSTVSVNATARFSIVTYTGNGSAGATVGHGLDIAPGLILLKQSTIDGPNWRVFHASAGAGNTAYLNLTDAFNADPDRISAVDADTFTLSSTSTAVNGNGNTYVAYCFAEVEGYSKIGSYTGNGSPDGPFVWCGFKPAFILSKRTDVADNWRLRDSARNPYNVVAAYLDANNFGIEGNASVVNIDFVANGVKVRGTDSSINTSGGTYAFIAVAEYPFGGVDTTPAPAR